MSLRGMALWEHGLEKVLPEQRAALQLDGSEKGLIQGVLAERTSMCSRLSSPWINQRKKQNKTLARKGLRNNLKIWSKSPLHHALINVTLTPQKPRESSQRG